VNLANAVRLQNRDADAKAILDRYDWTAVEDKFKLCVAAVRGEEDEVVRLMTVMGAHGPITADSYRAWPIFRGLRTNEKFAAAFQKIFGSRLLAPKAATTEMLEEQPADNSERSDINPEANSVGTD
jgi:hypothetical protein